MIRKGLSILLAIALLETSVLGSIPPKDSSASEVKTSLTFSDFGAITADKNYNSSKKIIIIQDLHCHPQTQRNISSIIKILDDKLKINNIYLEGAQGDIDMGWLMSIKDKSFSGSVAERLLESGKLTGAEYYAYKHNAGAKLKGIEDRDVHLSNLKRLSMITEAQSEIADILSSFSLALGKIQKQNYGALNIRLAALSERHRDGKISSVDYYKRLLSYTKKETKNGSVIKGFDVNAEDYSEISIFVNSSKGLRKTNVKVVQNQLAEVLNELKNKLPYGIYAEFINKTNSAGNTEELIKELVKFNADGFIDLVKHKELDNFIKAQNSSANINPVVLLNSERKLLRALQVKASASEQEMFTVIISELFEHFCDYYQAKLGSEDYKYITAFGIENYKYYWKQTTDSQEIHLLDKYDALLKDYYETNIDRDKIFAKNIFNSKMPGTSVVVCGGFHTQGLIKEFDEKKISYSVITPKITQDVKIADEIYNERLLSGLKTDSFALALQVISQGGSREQFVQILETLLHDELKRNSKLNIGQFINEIVNKICEIDEALLQEHLSGEYNRPVNNGVKSNSDGSIEIQISFANTTRSQLIEINLPKDNSAIPYASIFGRKYAKSAVLWEWVYAVPFSSIIMETPIFKKILKKLFLRNISGEIIDEAITFKPAMKFIDIAASLLFAAAVFSNIPSATVLITFFVTRSLIFTAAHNNDFNKNFKKVGILFFSSLFFSVPLAISAAFGFSYLVAALFFSMTLHRFFNVTFAAKIAVFLKNNYLYQAIDIRRCLADIEETVAENNNDPLSKGEQKRFKAALKAFKLLENKNEINKIAEKLIFISEQLTWRHKSGYLVNLTNNALAAKYDSLEDDVKNKLSPALRKYMKISALSMKNNRSDDRVLLEIIKSGEYIELRLYAYTLLKSRNKHVPENLRETLIADAEKIVKNFSWEKTFGNEILRTDFQNKILQSYISAVYLIMTEKHPEIHGGENRRIYQRILNARFDAKYDNANASLSFGKEYFMREKVQDYLPETIAHELGHIILKEKNFSTFRRILFFKVRNKEKAALHELYSDISAYLISDRLANFYQYRKSTISEEKITNFEEHSVARKQFDDFIGIAKRYGVDVDFNDFMKILESELKARKKGITFYDTVSSGIKKYLEQNGFRNIIIPDKAQPKKSTISWNTLDIMFGNLRHQASVFGGEYAKSSPLWEWIYMLPGTSFIADSKLFSKVLSKTFLKNKREQEIKDTLKTSKMTKVFDIAGSIVLTISALSGLGIAGLAVFIFTRAIIFSMAHKGFDWKKHWKERLILAGVFSAFSAFPLIAFQIFAVPVVLLAPFIISGNVVLHYLYNMLPFKTKASVFKAYSKEISVPSFDEIEKLALEIRTSNFKLSKANKDILLFMSSIKSKTKNLDDNAKELVLLQCFEFLGYVLQSQSWLSPSSQGAHYGFMQNQSGLMQAKYEREYADTLMFDMSFKDIFTKHDAVKSVKTKEAALFEYINKKSDKRGIGDNIQALIVPDTLSDSVISSLKVGSYPAFGLDSGRLDLILSENQGGCFIIDCSAANNVRELAERIDSYNKNVPEELGIKEVLFYNSDIKDYLLSDENYNFETSFIFDFSKFIEEQKHKEKISGFFTNVPAVYAGKDQLSLNYGSRLDNLTLHYLFLLSQRALVSNETHHHNASDKQNIPYISMETAVQYMNLYEELILNLENYDLYDDTRKSFYDIVMKNAFKNLESLNGFINGKPVNKEKLNNIIEEYRTLLNFLFYFEFSDRKDRNDIVSETEIDNLAGRLNDFMVKSKDSKGKAYSQTTILSASGMSAIKTIAAMLISGNVSKIAFGDSLYYENARMLKGMFENPETFGEEETEKIINLDSDAVFLDLISNSAELPLADIKGIVSGLAKKDYKKPFYLCIDNSMYPAFQVADIFNGIDLPDNFNIIIYGSMQKMHQRGLEITTSGFLTLMSNGRNHEKVLNQLKNASKATSSDIDAFKYTVLKEFIENNNITHHSEELNNNAAALASELKSISSVFGNTFDIVHPSLYPAEQKRIWEENGSPGIPFVFIRNTGNREIFYFTQPLHLELTRQNFAPMSRDSYGFVPCTTINYDMSTVRVSPGIDSVDRFVKMIDIFSETAFDYFISEILIYDSENKITDLMYDYVKSSNRSKKADELVYKYISSLKPKRALSDESVLNISIICGELGKPVPENIRLRAENILNDNKVSGNLTEEARKFSLDASVFGNKYAKSAPFWEWIYMIPGISFVADSKLFSKVLSETFFKNKSKQEINYTLKTSTAVKVIDIVGSIVLAVSVLSGVGIAGLAAFIFSRAIIFSMAHKGFDWKKHWKERLMLTGLFSAFTAFPLIALQLLSLSAVLFIPFIIFGNIALHSVYNNLPFKLKASIVEKSSEEKQIYIANIIKNKLSERLNISKEKIIINTDYEVKYGFVRTLSEAFYSDVNLSVKENDLIALNVPKSFLLAIYETYDSKRDEYIETFVENISVLYEVKQTVPEDKRDEAIISVLNGFNDRVADFARIASLKSSLFAAVTVPSFDEIMKISEDVQKSSFQWSGVNKDLLYVISIMQRLSKDLDDKAKQIILFQCMEFFGYILQSQTWLSPAHYDGQYGFMQDGSMASSYERERAHTSDLDPVFKSIFSNHSKTQIIKTKEAALFEYIIEKGNEKGSSLILPDSIVSDFKNIEIAFLEDKRYSSYLLDENEIDSLLKQQTSRSITDRYFIIDCSDTDNIETVAEKIEEYNKNVQERLKIKEVLFYNADLKDYVLSDKKLSFMTSYIFDFSKFIDERENRTALSGLFTNVPAVYVANHDGFVLDYGSRLDNFTLHYLYLLMDRQSIVHVPNVISADRRDIASPRAETIQEYKDLYDKLSNSLKKYNFFDGAKKIFYTTVMQNISENIKSLNDYINGKPVDTKKFNDIVDEYRTLLNFLFYFQWSDRKDIGNIISDSERDKLAERFNEFITKPKNSSGVPFSQNTVLATSGMSAAKTAVLMFMSENISKIAYGKNIYYENAYMFEGLNAFVDIDKFEEENTEEILAINTEAVFFDLISNASSIPLADIKRIISEFAKKKYQTPFYVCIDNSMYPAFQFADIFDGIDLPDNMYVIVYGSMQKMHQRGLEIVTSGFLTLMSNGYNHEQVLNRLKDASKFTSSEIDTFRHIALSEFVDSNEFLQRSKALNDNAEKTALALNDIARIFGDALSVFHPSLYSGDQKRIWEENSSAGIPFFFIKSVEKSEGRHMDAFLEFLFKKMLAETPFSPIVRDSYGFDSFTNVTYGFGDRAVRFNVGLDVERDMDKFLDVFAESAYEYYMNNKYTNISANEMIEKMYVYVTERRGGKKADELVYKYISSLNSNLVLPYADIVKIVTICNELGKPLPEVIKLNAEDILKDKKHDFHPRFFAFMLLKSENNSYALPEDMLSGLEKYTAAFDGLKIADKVNKKEFSNIDLQIMCGAVYAHMSSKYPELVKFTDEKGIYKAILNNAKIIENSGVFDASLSMGDKILKDSNIMRYIQENIIHEITHKYLLSAGISLGENQENAITFHEFYSELSALIFAKSVSEKEFDSFYANFIKDTSDEKYKNELHHLKARKQIIEILSAFNDSEISITDKRFISALEANMNAANSKKDLKEVVLAILSSMGKVNFSGNNLRNTEIIPGKEIAGMVKLFSESKEINKNYRINGNVIDAVYDSGSDMYEDFSSALDKFLETGVQTNILSPEQLIKAFVLSHRLNVKVNNAGFLNAVNKLIEISEINAGNLDAAPVYIDALKYISDKSLESIYLVRNDLLSIMEFYRGNGNPQQQAAASRSMLEMLDPLYQGTGDFVKDGIPATQNKDSIYKILSAA